MSGAMRTFKAHVKGGRLLVDEPTDLPEGSETEVIAFDDEDFDADERARLLHSIEEGAEAVERGDCIDGIAFATELLARREDRTR